MKSLLQLFFLCIVGISFPGMSDEDELLPSEEAFQFSADLAADNSIKVRWQIADGYYMYRDKMAFELIGDAIAFAPPTFPKGKIKQDDLFGTVEVYSEAFETVLPFSTHNTDAYQLIAKGQGCNEPVGVCYPPITHRISFAPSGKLTADTSSGQAPILETPSSQTLAENPGFDPSRNREISEYNDVNDLRNLLSAGFEQPDFLDVDEAFKLRIAASSGNRVVAEFEIAEGYYLYRDKVRFSQNGNTELDGISLPDGEIREDEYFGKVEILNKNFSVPIVLNNRKPGTDQFFLNATYQGCAEDGICYSPVNKTFDLGFPGIIDSAQADSEIIRDANTEIDEREQASFDQRSTDDFFTGLLPLLLSAFAAGLLLTFTPCVLPMIPILSSVIAGQGEKLTKLRGGSLAIFYVLGTTVTYAAMGAVAGATGDQLQSYFQNAWAIGTLSAIFVLMALSMFGLYEIQMPSFIQSALQQQSGKFTGSIPLVFILGLVSALIVGACVSPILISFLTLAVSRGDPMLGAQIMFAMAWGMGLPLIALGFGAGYLIPRAGKWMDTVKHIFGVMLIAVAIYLLQALPEVPILLLWGSFLIIVSVYLGAHRPLAKEHNGWHKLSKGTGITLLVWGILVLIGGFLGQRDLFNPIPQSIFTPTSRSTPTAQHLFTRVDSLQQLDQRLVEAKQQNKKVLIDYYADWCVDCVKMEKTTFADNAVRQILKTRFITLQIDVTDPNDAERKALKKRYNVFGPPAVLFLDSRGRELSDFHFYGYKAPSDFLAHLSKL